MPSSEVSNMEDVIYVNESYMNEYVSDDMFNDESYIGDLDMYEEMYVAETQSFIEKMADFIKRLFKQLSAKIKHYVNKRKLDKINGMLNDPESVERLKKQQTKKWDHNTFMDMIRACEELVDYTWKTQTWIFNGGRVSVDNINEAREIYLRRINAKWNTIKDTDEKWSKYDAYTSILEEYKLLAELDNDNIAKVLQLSDSEMHKLLTGEETDKCTDNVVSVFYNIAEIAAKGLAMVLGAPHFNEEIKTYNASEYTKYLA